MFIVHVSVNVKPGDEKSFKAASMENALNSIQEAGIARFDVLQEADNPTKFLLIEVYRKPEDALAHKETAHYLKWRDTVADMMAVPRTAVKYSNVFPGETGFDVSGVEQ